MRTTRWLVTVACLTSAAGFARAVEGDGLRPAGDPGWSRWQGRLSLITEVAPSWRTDASGGGTTSRMQAAGLLGDYYFFRSASSERSPGGFRATGGLFLGSRTASTLSLVPRPVQVGRDFSAEHLSLATMFDVPFARNSLAENGGTPYLGVGYTSMWPRSRWGFSADLGVMALQPSSAVKLGQVLSGRQTLDDTLRDLRLAPLVQVGVSYSF